MRCVNRYLGVAAGVLVFSLAGQSAFGQNLISNGGFEGSLTGNWGAFGNAYQIINAGPTAYDGVGEAKLYGTFPGTSGFYQDFAATSGDVFNSSAWGQNWSGDAMQATNDGFLRVTFFNSSNVEIAGAGVNSADIDVNTPVNTWTALSINDIVAPTGTAYGQVLLLFTQPGVNGGSAWFDDVSVTAAPEPMTVFGLSLGALVLLKHRKRA